MGSANTRTNGISKPTACATTHSDALRFISKPRTSFNTVPSISTKVQTATVMRSVIRICRVK